MMRSAKASPLRVLITVLGLDQHEAGALTIARLLRDAGAEVIYGGRFQVPATITQVAIEEDVDVVGISAHSWEFLHYAGELATMLHGAEPSIPVIVGGSVVTSVDRDEVLELGVDRVVLPTASEEEMVNAFFEIVSTRKLSPRDAQ